MTRESHEVDKDRPATPSTPGSLPLPSPPGSPGSKPRSRQVSAADLPDLTDQLVNAGIYDKYVEYRDNYKRWRRGGHHGAKGEVSDVVQQANSKDPYKFEVWFPTPQKFHFFFTVSYWAAILALEGSFFFTLACALPYLCEATADVMLLVGWCNITGATLFTLGVYCCYLELINLQDSERVYTVPSLDRWQLVLRHVRWDSFTGTMIYVFASIGYNFMAFIPVFPSLGSQKLAQGLACFGGLGFFIGGLCEVSHTRQGAHGHAAKLSSVIAWLNCFGGFLFFVGGAGEAIDHHRFSVLISLSYLIGSLIYVVSSVLLLIMWQGNDFGGTLFSQLSHAIQAGGTVSIAGQGEGMRVRVSQGPPGQGVVRRRLGSLTNLFRPNEMNGESSPTGASKKKLSLRDVLSLCIYCWLFTSSTSNFIAGALLAQHGRRNYTDVAMALIWILGVKVVLVLHSAITSVPNEQPYRFATQSMWCLLFAATLVQTVDLMNSIPLRVSFGGHPAATNNHTAAATVELFTHGGEL